MRICSHCNEEIKEGDLFFSAATLNGGVGKLTAEGYDRLPAMMMTMKVEITDLESPKMKHKKCFMDLCKGLGFEFLDMVLPVLRGA
mgnify:CR=1 FL=1